MICRRSSDRRERGKKPTIQCCDFITELRGGSTAAPVSVRIYPVFFVLLRVFARADRLGQIIFIAEGLGQLLQGNGKHLVNPFHRANLKIVLDIVRHFFQVPLILFRDDDRLDATTTGSEQLFFQAADR